jgi:hypothetical protein
MVLKLLLFVPGILNGVYIVMYIIMLSEAPLPQYLHWLTVVLHCVKENCVSLARWDTICVACHNSIVRSRQLCSVEHAFTCMFKDFCCLRYVLALGSVSDIQLLAGKIPGRIWKVQQ